MNLIKRLKFAYKYNFEPEFIVCSIPDQSAMQFLNFDDAKEFSDKQIAYKPHVMVVVKENK